MTPPEKDQAAAEAAAAKEEAKTREARAKADEQHAAVAREAAGLTDEATPVEEPFIYRDPANTIADVSLSRYLDPSAAGVTSNPQL